MRDVTATRRGKWGYARCKVSHRRWRSNDDRGRCDVGGSHAFRYPRRRRPSPHISASSPRGHRHARPRPCSRPSHASDARNDSTILLLGSCSSCPSSLLRRRRGRRCVRARRTASSLPQHTSWARASCWRCHPPSCHYDGRAHVQESGQPRLDQLHPPWRSVAWRCNAGSPIGRSAMTVGRSQVRCPRGSNALAQLPRGVKCRDGAGLGWTPVGANTRRCGSGTQRKWRTSADPTR